MRKLFSLWIMTIILCPSLLLLPSPVYLIVQIFKRAYNFLIFPSFIYVVEKLSFIHHKKGSPFQEFSGIVKNCYFIKK